MTVKNWKLETSGQTRGKLRECYCGEWMWYITYYRYGSYLLLIFLKNSSTCSIVNNTLD